MCSSDRKRIHFEVENTFFAIAKKRVVNRLLFGTVHRLAKAPARRVESDARHRRSFCPDPSTRPMGIKLSRKRSGIGNSTYAYS
jgi:hypothetical protein